MKCFFTKFFSIDALFAKFFKIFLNFIAKIFQNSRKYKKFILLGGSGSATRAAVVATRANISNILDENMTTKTPSPWLEGGSCLRPCPLRRNSNFNFLQITFKVK